MPCERVDEPASAQRKHRGPSPRRIPTLVAKRTQAVAKLEARTGSAAEIAERHGVSRAAHHMWCRDATCDDVRGTEERGAFGYTTTFSTRTRRFVTFSKANFATLDTTVYQAVLVFDQQGY